MKKGAMLLLTLLAMKPGQCFDECPVWTVYNSTSEKCECGNSLGGVVHCDPQSLKISLMFCYCMTFSQDTKKILVGPCMERCYHKNDINCIPLNEMQTNSTENLNEEMCGDLKRKGQHCGDCIEGHGWPVYSYSTACVNCTESNFTQNFVKYIAVAFLPLTAFYFIVLLFKISITTGNMAGYIFICQILTEPALLRATSAAHLSHTDIFIAMFSMWNSDFFRSLYTPFCIHPRMSALHVLALDYLVGIYSF